MIVSLHPEDALARAVPCYPAASQSLPADLVRAAAVM